MVRSEDRWTLVMGFEPKWNAEDRDARTPDLDRLDVTPLCGLRPKSTRFAHAPAKHRCAKQLQPLFPAAKTGEVDARLFRQWLFELLRPSVDGDALLAREGLPQSDYRDRIDAAVDHGGEVTLRDRIEPCIGALRRRDRRSQWARAGHNAATISAAIENEVAA